MPTSPTFISTVVPNRKDLINMNDIAIDGSDNLYITDSISRIFKVDREGSVSRVAGTGVSGFSGDQGLASEAQVSSPHGIAFDSKGNLYFADLTMNLIRKVEPQNNKISTFVGPLKPEAFEQFYGSFDGDGKTVDNARLNYPMSIAFDSADNLYIADTNNHRIRKVDKQTNKISTFAGKDTAGFGADGSQATQAELFHPSCIAFDSLDNLYIADTGNHRIRKVDLTGSISTVAGIQWDPEKEDTSTSIGDGGPAINAKLKRPWGIAIDGNDILYIADTGNNRIRMVDREGKISTIAGNGTNKNDGDYKQATEASIGRPSRIAIDSGGNLYIADTLHNVIRKVELPTFSIPYSPAYEFGTGPFSVMAVVTTRTKDKSNKNVIATGNIASRNLTHHAELSAGWQLSIISGPGNDQYLLAFSVQGNDGSRCEVLAPLINLYIDKPWQSDRWEIQTSENVHKELVHNITAVRDDRGECRLYLDGNLVGQNSCKGLVNVSAPNTPLSIGKLFPSPPPPDGEYGGVVRKVSLWKGALKQKDIIKHTNYILDPANKSTVSGSLGCVGFWEFNGTGQDTCDDLSATKNHVPANERVTSEKLPMVLPFYTEYQHTDQWCWAGVAVSIENFYNPLSIVEQCSLVTDVMRDPDLKTKIPLKSQNPDVMYTLPEGKSCCDSPQDYRFWYYLDDALTKLKICDSWNSSLTFDEYMEQIRKWRPVAVRIEYQGGSGHFMVLIGAYLKSGDKIIVDDPYFGISVINFSSLVSSNQYHNAKATHFYLTKPQPE